MTTELQKAAERHRANRYQDETEIYQDAQILAQAYLAEHPADDDEVIDKGWLKMSGWEKTAQGECDEQQCWKRKIDDCRFLEYETFTKRVYLTIDLAPYDTEESVLCLKNPTRGQLRSLLKALGIEVKP